MVETLYWIEYVLLNDLANLRAAKLISLFCDLDIVYHGCPVL